MPTETITVENVAVAAEGVKDNRHWTRYAITGGGYHMETFNGQHAEAARQAKEQGKKAEVEFEPGKYGLKLKDIKITENGAASEEFRAKTPDGAVDWDIKDLRINRCAFWKEIIGPAMEAGLAKHREANPDAGQMELIRFTRSFGTSLRMVAEADIYLDKHPAGADDWIPFLEGHK